MRAIVIGGGMAGLLAARALCSTYDQIILIDRDHFPHTPIFRDGVPQAKHGHLLLSRGQAAVMALFPEMETVMQQEKIAPLRWGLDTAMYTTGGWMKQVDTGITTYACSRSWLEWQLRELIQRLPQVQIMPATKALRLCLDASNTKVTGLEIQAGDQPPQVLTADLVVDAAGRRSQAVTWLQAMGDAAPPETLIDAFVGYATRWYTDVQLDSRLLIVQARPAEKNYRTAGLVQVEGGRWAVTVGGANRDYPPNDPVAFMEYLRQLPSPAIYEALQAATPISPVYGYRETANRWRHFEQLKRQPENFIVLGDAVCSFNPVYAQGMTVAALGAQLLQTMTAASPSRNGLAHRFQKRLAREVIAPAWLMSTSADLIYPETIGPRPAYMRLAGRYLDALANSMSYDAAVTTAFLGAMHMLVAPTALLKPGFLFKALRYQFS